MHPQHTFVCLAIHIYASLHSLDDIRNCDVGAMRLLVLELDCCEDQ